MCVLYTMVAKRLPKTPFSIPYLSHRQPIGKQRGTMVVPRNEFTTGQLRKASMRRSNAARMANWEAEFFKLFKNLPIIGTQSRRLSNSARVRAKKIRTQGKRTREAQPNLTKRNMGIAKKRYENMERERKRRKLTKRVGPLKIIIKRRPKKSPTKR